MKQLSLLLGAVLFLTVSARADLRLPALFSDHAMLQANKPIAVWGWADPNAMVKVTFVGTDATSSPSFSATADANGKWSGQLPALKPGTAGQLEVTSTAGQKTVSDVLVGEVWLGGGQSNMSYEISGKGGADFSNPEEVAQITQNVAIAEKEADAAKPSLRYFKVTLTSSIELRDDVKGNWIIVDSKNVKSLSAVAWNFGIALQNKLNEPIGLIVSAWPSTAVESWMSPESLAATSVGAAVVERHRQAVATSTPEVVAKNKADTEAWLAANPTDELKSKNKATRPPQLEVASSYREPSNLYNAMIHGLMPYTLQGIIWFQADGNIKHPQEYGELFVAMIKSWREEWKDPLPFYYVEMNSMFQELQSKPVQPDPMPLLREQQRAALKLPNTGVVASIDLGLNLKNPHFPNKKPVGERLAALALRDCYHQPGQASSPLFQSFTVEGKKVRLKFSDAEGLRIRGGGTELKGFAIRGSSGGWVWATGSIDGSDILVWSDQVPSPTAVRYDWAKSPIVSVENNLGYPLLPFRTDTDSAE